MELPGSTDSFEETKNDMKNLKQIFEALSLAAAPAYALFGDKAHDLVQRWVTIPESDRAKLLAKLDAEDRAKAEAILARIFDDVSDVALLIASKGGLQPD